MNGWGWSAAPLVVAWAWGLAALLWAIVAAVELGSRRPRRRRRLLALALLVAMLAALVAAPVRRREVAAESALLLTAGASRATAEGLRVLTTEPSLPGLAIPDLAFVGRREPQIAALEVRGEGLPAWEWETSPIALTGFVAAPPRRGFERVHWPRRLVLGGRLEVWGRVVGETEGEILLAGGGLEARAALGRDGVFRVSGTPRRRGRFELRLTLTGAGAAVEERLHVEVVAPRLPALLWLESAPSFETRHVKEWYRERGGRLAVRSAISRERYASELYHLEPRALAPVTAGLLEGFDVVVVDRETLRQLGGDERAALERAVATEGVGVLVRVAGRAGRRGELDLGALGRWRWRPIGDLETFELRPLVDGRTLASLTAPARQWSDEANSAGLVLDAGGRSFVAVRAVGLGRVAVTLLDETYRWALAGRRETHEAVWSRVLETLARPEPDGGEWRLPPEPILVDEPLDLELATGAELPDAWVEEPPSLAAVAVALRQDAADPERWRSRFWPRRSGWHRLSGAGVGEAWFFAQEASAWSAWQRARATAATRSRLLETAAIQGARERPPVTVERPVSRLWLFLGVVALTGWLWLDERLWASASKRTP